MKRRTTSTVHAWACAMLLVMSAGCSDSHGRNQAGGETHFMTACLDGVCEGGLACVCGVCTTACSDDEACAALGGGASCQDVRAETLLCGGEAPSESRVCDSACSEDDHCGALGSSYECVDGRCRPSAVVSMLTAGQADAGDDAAVEGDGGAMCADGNCGSGIAPLVMIVLDTSGSMERLAECVCETPSCTECLPDCASDPAQKNRWAETLEVLTGTYESFTCEALERTGPDFTYDADYTFPYHKPSGAQRSDGVLREHAARLRFGIATFDSAATYGRDTQLTMEQFDFARSAGMDGMWSYPPGDSAVELLWRGDGIAAGAYRYPNTEFQYIENTGIRGREADDGRLIVETARSTSLATLSAIEASLRATRPFGGSPIASALEDTYWLFAHDPMMSEERENAAGQRHLILISDGRPDDDYRSVGCDCFEDENASDCGEPPNVPEQMHCPYPLPEQAAWRLRCGEDGCQNGLFHSVHVVGFALDDEITIARMNRISQSAGSPEAILASNGEQLRSQLDALLADIASGRYRDGGGTPERPSASGE